MSFRLFFLAVTFILPATAFGERPELNVVTSEYPPYEYFKDGEVIGEDTETIRRTLSEMGYKAKIRILPWARAEKLVREGQADMLYSLTSSSARQQNYFFTDPINTAQDVFFKRKDQSLEWQTLDDLTGLNFGLSAGYSYANEFMDWLFSVNARITRITHEQPDITGLRMAALGRIDLFICEQSVCEYLLDKYAAEFPELALVEQMPGNVGPQRSFRAAFSRKLPNGRELRDEFNAALKKVTKEKPGDQ
jgi:polar amino acid transport system substrate-binding protein